MQRKQQKNHANHDASSKQHKRKKYRATSRSHNTKKTKINSAQNMVNNKPKKTKIDSAQNVINNKPTTNDCNNLQDASYDSDSSPLTSLYYDAELFLYQADAMCHLYVQNLTLTQKTLLDETISLCQHLVQRKKLTVSNGIARVHDVLKYFMRCAFNTTNDICAENDDFAELVLQNCDVYYNAALFEQTITKMCNTMKTFFTNKQKMVLDETIALHKHLVESQDIIVAEAITRVLDVLQHLETCAATLHNNTPTFSH